MPIRIGLVGIGKIARDQHLPALMNDADFTLAAAVSRHGVVAGVETFPDIESMIRAAPALDAVSLCTPPSGRHALARVALAAGLHVMLEKPPGATVGEVTDLEARASAKGVTLFATWHSREAAGVEPASAWLAKRVVRAVRVTWKEDIRVWHPGQEWILAPGGLGVFDPGINALSILTRILPQRLTLRGASLSFPANRAAPIAAQLDFIHGESAPVTADFDFLQTGPQRWDIEIDTDEGQLLLSEGGRRLRINGVERITAPDREYAALYSRFRTLVAGGMSDVDVSPLQHVADAFLLGRRLETAAFEF
jgi:predicted dehydrogenase